MQSKFRQLVQKSKKGYLFGQPTYYGPFHLGIDVMLDTGTELPAPESGQITWIGFGIQGGKQMHFVGDSGVLHRLMHLDSWAGWHKGARVKIDELLAISGNTGKFTTAPHLHWDISKNGVLDLKNRSNFMDPEVWVGTERNKMKLWLRGFYRQLGWDWNDKAWNDAREFAINTDPEIEGENFAKATKGAIIESVVKHIKEL